MHRIPLTALVLFCPIALVAQAEWPKPHWEKVEMLSCKQSGLSSPVGKYTVGKFEVRLVAPPDPTSHDILCRGYLIDPAQRQTLLLEDWEVSVYQGTGEDVFGDGNPSLILEGYSGGAHCCYTYKIVSLAEPPVILPAIQNEAPFYFFKDKASGHFRIMTSDGAFDYFDGACHACLPFPRVVLKPDDEGLHDVSSEFVDQYDSDIALARAKIGEGNIGKFLVSDFKDAKSVVLEIVFSYLYSGRATQAWQTLDEMWPAGDREQIKQLILKARAKGILSKLAKTRPVP